MTNLIVIAVLQTLLIEPQVVYSTTIATIPSLPVAQGQVVVLPLSRDACRGVIRVREQEYRCRPDNKVIIGMPMDITPRVYEVTTSDGVLVASLDVSPTRWQRDQRRAGGVGKPAPADVLKRDRAAKNAAFTAHLEPKLATYHLTAPLQHPLQTAYRISDPFGIQRFYGASTTPTIHGGVDMAAPESGTWQRAPPVAHSMASGIVVLAASLWAEGNMVIVYHGDSIYTAYLHLKSISVKMGDKVTAGRPLGIVGSTGHSSGAHLHLIFRIHGTPVDPLMALSILNEQLK